MSSRSHVVDGFGVTTRPWMLHPPPTGRVPNTPIPGHGYGAAIWRKIGVGPWTQIFPAVGISDPTSYPFLNAAALNGIVYATTGNALNHDGSTWARGPDLAGFERPITFGGVIVFEALGLLWTFDGARVHNTGIPMGDVPGLYESADDHLVVVTADNRVLVTTDLSTWTCAGLAPPAIASVGVLDGVLYFGGTDAQIFAHDGPAW